MTKMLKVKDIQEALGCSTKKVYAIVNQKDFPKIKIGKTFYIPEDEFDKWVKNILEKNINYDRINGSREIYFHFYYII